MKYEELSFEEIKIEEVKIERYKEEEVVGKVTKCYYSPCEIKKVVVNGKTYLRDREEIQIDWLGDKLEEGLYFFDKKSDETIWCMTFRNEKGELCYGFTDHND